MSDPVIAFREALQMSLGPLDWLPIGDGEIHRFHVPGDKSGTRNGWYALHLVGIACGVFGSWKAGGCDVWSSRQPADSLEAELIRRRIEQARQQREAEQQQRQQQAAMNAQRLWRDARRADPEHAYLVAKQCRAHGLRQQGDALLVPLTCGGEVVNLQRIYPDGHKRFLSGGKVRGAYTALGVISSTSTLYVCEGWATGATLHEHTGSPVACAMNAGNLTPVALVLRERYPNATLVIAGDDDRNTEGNPGRVAANAAAIACAGQVVFPKWPAGAPNTLTDFNDLAIWSQAHEHA